MKEEISIIALSSIIVIVIGLLAFNFNNATTGFSVYNLTEIEGANATGLANESRKASEQDVLNGIRESEEIIDEFRQNNFSIIYINDSLIEAKRLLKQAQYAEILRNESSNASLRAEAEAALQLVEWQEIDYDDAIVHITNISERKKIAYIIYDSITATEISLKGYEGRGVNVSTANSFLSKAKVAFYEDQYGNAESLLNSVREELRLQVFSFSILNAVKRGVQSFIEKYWKNYWHVIVLIFTMISLVAFFAYRKILELVLKARINRAKIEKEALIELMKRTQEDRFKKNIVPGMIYNLRMRKYNEKLNDVEKRISVLQDKLNKLHIPIGYLKVTTCI